mmetsp:Transcript_620/g.1655  ORF Transcript_620/g.1655 Transcript_620/m.1655 type:complete len:832 (-) Transcript_620:1455-3950(-)
MEGRTLRCGASKSYLGERRVGNVRSLAPAVPVPLAHALRRKPLIAKASAQPEEKVKPVPSPASKDSGAANNVLTRTTSTSKKSSSKPTQKPTLMLCDVSLTGRRAGMLLGFVHWFETRVPSVGFFQPVGGGAYPGSSMNIDRHVELVHRVCGLRDDPQTMVGVSEAEAKQSISSGHNSAMLDKIFARYAAYCETHDFVVVEGPGPILGGTELDAAIAQTISSPVLMSISGHAGWTAQDYYNLAMVKRQVFVDHKVDVVGVMLNLVPREGMDQLVKEFGDMLRAQGLILAGAIPEDPIMASVRLDEVAHAIGGEVLFGHSAMQDHDYDEIITASQRVEELLEMLDANPNSRPLIVTSQDRLDIVLGLLAAQLSVKGPAVAGVVLTRAGRAMDHTRYAKDTVARIFDGIEHGGVYKGSLLPILAVDKTVTEVLNKLSASVASILPSSTRKINHVKILFERNINVASVMTQMQNIPRADRITPKMFMHMLRSQCLRDPQRIVLPESLDKRILEAAAISSQRGLAHITLLGDPAAVQNEAKKLGLDISKVTIRNPKEPHYLDKYVDALVEARKKKGLMRDVAMDIIRGDDNYYGVMMVHCDDADGMVSGAIHTTAATVRPAMQVLKNPKYPLISSVFFMCLPDKILVYGDCAVNTNPTAEELAQIAMTAADTAEAFGITPRVAMLSYSTLGSGSGPDVNKVTEAVALVKKERPDIKVEGPIQYDAAIDPKVAAVKVKGKSEVAGRATVFVFPDLNTGNNTYKAVQQASGAVAVGPVMQGLSKPVNDLSRGCTVQDVVDTITVTSIQAMQIKNAQARRYNASMSASIDLVELGVDV